MNNVLTDVFYSRVAQKLDVTGILASIFAAACGVGGMTSVPFISYLSKASSRTAMIWTILVLSIVHICLAVPMWMTARRFKAKEGREAEEKANQLPLETIKSKE